MAVDLNTLTEIGFILDSLIQAIMAEPERFLAYISLENWKNIFTASDFVSEFIKAFSPLRALSQNFYASRNWQLAIKFLWQNKFTEAMVKRNYEQAKKEYKREGVVERVSRRELFERKYKIVKNITVTLPSGKRYIKSFRRWTDRETAWLDQNKATKPSILTDMYNLLFSKSPRTKDSIIGKRRRLK